MRVLAALKELGGCFMWTDTDGEEYIIISRREYEKRLTATDEEQLDLLSRTGRMESFDRPKTADDMLEKINQDLALYQLQQAEEEEEFDDTHMVIEEEQLTQFPLPAKSNLSFGRPGKRVRFEPLRGDLSPELQD